MIKRVSAKMALLRVAFIILTTIGILGLILVGCSQITEFFGGVQNDPPTVSIVTKNQPISEGTELTLEASGSDPNGDSLSYSWEARIESSNEDVTKDTLSGQGASVTFKVEKVDQETDYKLIVTAKDDNGAEDSDSVIITVQPASVASVTVTPNTVSVDVGESATLSARVEYSNATTDSDVDWSSSSTAVATISDDGTARGIASGNAVITAAAKKDTSKSATAAVTVLGPPLTVSSLDVSPTSVNVEVGKTATLTATVYYSDNSYDSNVSWASADTAIAVVSVDGAVTGVATGNTTVTVSSNKDTNKSATAAVTVIAPPSPTATVASLSVAPASVSIAVNQTATLEATVTYSDGATDSDVTWSSSPTSVATVSSSGAVTGVASGSATIMATSNRDTSKSATAAVTVIIPAGPFDVLFSGISGYNIHVGQILSAAVVKTSNNSIVHTDSTTVTPNGQFFFEWIDILEGGESYNIDFYADITGNGSCDPPPTDHAWRIPIGPVLSNININDEHDTNFLDVCGTFEGFNLSFSGNAYNVHIGQPLSVKIVRVSDNVIVQSDSMIVAADGSFSFNWPGILKLGQSYNIDFYADVSPFNGSCDTPPDHAWRMTLGPVTDNITIDDLHDTNFIDVCSTFGP